MYFYKIKITTVSNEKKEGFFSKIWKDPDAEQQEEVRTPKTTPFTAAKNTTIPATEFVSPKPQGTRKQEVVDFLFKVRVENNLQGPDYHELALALEDMKADTPDEKDRIVNAFKVFKTMGLTPEKLIETANHYKKLYAQKREGFESSVNKELQVAVGDREGQKEQLSTRNLKIDEEIKILTAEKMKNEEKIKTLNDEIQSNSQRITERKADFIATYDDVVGEIDRNISLINQHLIKK